MKKIYKLEVDMILDKIDMPNDLKNLSINEMETLAEEMRKLIIKKVNAIGGHMGPNLGIVEATIALHYVFNFLSDKIILIVFSPILLFKLLLILYIKLFNEASDKFNSFWISS